MRRDTFAERLKQIRLLQQLSQRTIAQTGELIETAHERVLCSGRTVESARMLLREHYNGRRRRDQSDGRRR